MKALEVLRYYFHQRPLLREMHPHVERLRNLRTGGVVLKYKTAEGATLDLPHWLMPTTRIIGNLGRQGFSHQAVQEAIAMIEKQFSQGILKPGDVVNLSDILGLNTSPIALFGATWGDEGKGRVAHFFTSHIHAHMVVRFNGGLNSGKIVVTDKKDYEFCMLPAGIVHPNVRACFTQGVLISIPNLIKEMEFLEQNGIPTKGRVFIAGDCHLIMPYHIEISAAKNFQRQSRATYNRGMAEGSTGSGVGSSVEDLVARIGIRLHDLYNDDEVALKNKLRVAIKIAEAKIRANTGNENFKFEDGYVDEIYEKYCAFGKRLLQMATVIEDMPRFLKETMKKGQKVLFEGSQAALLDPHQGVYPDCTSTPTTPSGLFEGTGLSAEFFPIRIGIIKSYLAIRGKSPLPTEMVGPEKESFRERAREFEVSYDVTNAPLYEPGGKNLKYDKTKPIAIGWPDALVLAYTANLGYSHMILTKLDVFDSLETIKIAVGYRYKGDLDLRSRNYDIEIRPDGEVILKQFVPDSRILKDCEPIYEELPGWAKELRERGLASIQDIKSFEDLPLNAQAFVRKFESYLGIPLAMVSVGQEKDQMVSVPEK